MKGVKSLYFVKVHLAKSDPNTAICIACCSEMVTFLYLSVLYRDSYNNISALDPKKLKIFNTVREITGVCLCVYLCHFFCPLCTSSNSVFCLLDRHSEYSVLAWRAGRSFCLLKSSNNTGKNSVQVSNLPILCLLFIYLLSWFPAWMHQSKQSIHVISSATEMNYTLNHPACSGEVCYNFSKWLDLSSWQLNSLKNPLRTLKVDHM